MPSAAAAIRAHAAQRAGRFERDSRRPAMRAVVTTGHGGLDRLEQRVVPRPEAIEGEVLIRVLAAGLNNTDVNTRVGWYSRSVSSDTWAASQARERPPSEVADGGWSGATPFPLVQGVDCCGEVVEAGSAADGTLVGRRVLVRPCMRPAGFGSLESVWMGVDFDGAFAQYVTAPSSEVFPVDCDLTDVELGAIPCAFGTAENMLQRAGVRAGYRVLIAGASGGVGSAAVQLAKLRGAHVTAIAAERKAADIRRLGADAVVDREADIRAAMGGRSADVVLDTVAGPEFGELVDALAQGGRYAVCGAIAGPMVTLDARTLYLRDISITGCTAWGEGVFPSLVGRIERGEIQPLIAGVFALEDVAAAQTAFMAKERAGKYVLVPAQPDNPRG